MARICRFVSAQAINTCVATNELIPIMNTPIGFIFSLIYVLFNFFIFEITSTIMIAINIIITVGFILYPKNDKNPINE